MQLAGALMLIFTFVLAVFTGLLWWSTRQLSRITSRQQETTQRIAKHSDVSERAYVTMSHAPPGLKFDPENSPKIGYSVDVEIKNHGRTPARVSDVRLKAQILPKDAPLPTHPDYRGNQTLETARAFLVPNTAFVVTEPLGTIDPATLAQLRAGELRLFVYGYVDYDDRFGKFHRAGYARVFAPHREGTANNLVFVGQSEYNDDVEIPAPSASKPGN